MADDADRLPIPATADRCPDCTQPIRRLTEAISRRTVLVDFVPSRSGNVARLGGSTCRWLSTAQVNGTEPAPLGATRYHAHRCAPKPRSNVIDLANYRKDIGG